MDSSPAPAAPPPVAVPVVPAVVEAIADPKAAHSQVAELPKAVLPPETTTAEFSEAQAANSDVVVPTTREPGFVLPDAAASSPSSVTQPAAPTKAKRDCEPSNTCSTKKTSKRAKVANLTRFEQLSQNFQAPPAQTVPIDLAPVVPTPTSPSEPTPTESSPTETTPAELAPSEPTPTDSMPSFPPAETTPTETPAEATPIEPAPAATPTEPPPTETPTELTPAEPSPVLPESQQVQVEKIQIVGSTVLTAKDVEPLVQPLQGRTVTIADLETLADNITQIYLQRGFLTSRALLDRDSIANGNVAIQVIEDTLEEIQVEGLRRLKSSYIKNRIQRAAGTPINVAKLEDQLRLLRADPLFSNIEATLRVGSGLGKTVLVVRATEANPFSGNVFINNYSPPSVGSEQFGTFLTYRNLTGNGDFLYGGYTRSTTGGSEEFDLGYQIPINPSEGTIRLQANWSNSEITQSPFSELGIRADSEQYGITYRQPIIRNSREELALSVGFSYQDGQTFIFNDVPFFFGIGPDADGRSRTSVVQLGQEYIRRDSGGAWAFRSLFNIGTGLFDATQNPGSDIPDGQFFAWLGQAQRVQRLGDNHLLVVQADVQLTPDSLLPSQQFVIGGGQSVRGYRQNARTGDNGFRFSIEDRITLDRDANGSPIVQVAPFFEMGSVWNVSGNPNPLPDQNFLAGVGVGLLWQPVRGLNVRVDYGLPLIRLDDRGNNLQDSGVYFSVNYQF